MKTSINYPDIFCQRLKAARLSKGLSQKSLGILAGIDEFVASTRINRYEKGVHQANIEIAQQLATALDVPLAYFYMVDDQLAELTLSWGKLSDLDKTELLAQAKAKSSLWLG
ncbi:putative transcriptional regulator [Buttiauxella ferragutiae ATCC 51602]|uniref:Transcriptional regulator n=1 Tax=Buttiauxella ferragutiae ATCC 51602 TaxID=1354252 RepID=A0ABX2WDM2_9ENTR|nr:helix-turn-helix transcriptional regulator [Buttiauxella ferragutiae]OAT33023.1 putative transcriptional regulator [Buttiauxella ferragutiae ATCC 51602]